LLLSLLGGPVVASEEPVSTVIPSMNPLESRIFFFSGFDFARGAMFGWAGVTAAPFGMLDEDGWRLRILGGAGRYRYRTSAARAGFNNATLAGAEILSGVQRSFMNGALTAYVGPHLEEQRIAEPDPGNTQVGTKFGVKVATEICARVDSVWLLNASASASTLRRTYHARTIVVRELAPMWAVGIEGAVYGDMRYTEPRAGILVNSAYGKSTVTLAAGVLANSANGRGVYATLSLYAPY
jgi:hypothetical protein